MENFLNNTIRNISWFKGAFDRGELDMKPPFQRNPVWVNRQKSFLIDTILSGYPIPEIYMQETVDEKGKAKYIIVDGQQRTRAILEYLEGAFCIDGKDSPDYADLFFDDLSAEQKKTFFKYNFVIRILPDVRDTELREVFQRLNKNVVSLNKQELRQATYWGPFIKTMNRLSDLDLWSEIDVFTPNDIRRMLDVEFISELSVAVFHGLQNKKDNLDKYYGIYEEDFEDSKTLINIFETVLGEMVKILPNISKLRWSKKTDFYSLFIYLSKHYKSFPLSKEQRELSAEILIKLAEDLNYYVKTSKEETGIEYKEHILTYGKGIRASTDLGSRKNREAGISSQMDKVFE